MYGEIVTAIVATQQRSSSSLGVSSDDLEHHDLSLTADLKEFLKSRMASYKQPRKYHFIEALPRNLMGKVRNESSLDLLLTSTNMHPILLIIRSIKRHC